jgi:N-acetylglucosamine-6-sulfatase
VARPEDGTTPARRSGRLVALSLVVVVVAVAVAVAGFVVSRPGGSSRGTHPTPSASTGRPNIVLILTDDQRFDELNWMPTVDRELVGKGVDFTNGFVVNSLCCPSRTTILTGKYSHGTGVYTNNPPHGGFRTFEHEEGSTVATWLHGAGYRTALVGKYLNGYLPGGASHVPPGWDRWDAEALAGGAKEPGGYFNYDMSIDGKRVHYGNAPKDYSTDVLTQYATGFISSTPSSQPLFLYFAPRAPHYPSTPALRDRNACPNLAPYRPPNFNEADVSDKPAYIRAAPLLSPAKQALIDHVRLDHCRSLQDVDRSVGRILDALRRTGRLSNTLIVFASDNGISYGEHRWDSKYVPYEESIRVPIVVRYDPLTRGVARTSDRLALNLDFAPTFAAAAGVRAPGAEGRSLLPLLAGPEAPWRSSFLVEHWESPRSRTPEGVVPTYCAVRTTRFMFVEYETGERELYDLRRDPYELRNLAGDPADARLVTQLHTRLVQLCSPPPPGFHP